MSSQESPGFSRGEEVKVVIITEKPSAAKNFAAALGGKSGTYKGEKYQIVNAVGHVYELLPPNEQTRDEELAEKLKVWNVKNLPWKAEDIQWRLGVQHGKSGVVSELKKAMASASEIVMACDVDPTGEGDKISGDIILQAGMENKKISRMNFLDEAKSSLQKAFEERTVIPSLKDYGPLKMAEFRSRFDYLFGLQSTRLITLKSGQRTVVRQGRLKSPITLLVGDQLKAYESYVKKPFFQNRFKDENGVIYTDPEEQKYDKASDVPTTFTDSAVVRDSSTMKSTKPPKLIDLAELSARLAPRGMKPKAVLAVYQKMYEAGVVSYPRTEDKTITSEQFKEMLPLIDKIAAVVGVDTAGLTHRQPRSTHVKDAGAHGANRPGPNVPGSLKELDSRFGAGASAIYDILARSFLAMVSEDYEYEQQKGHVEKYPSYVGVSNVPKKAGWKAVYDADADDEDEGSAEGLGTKASPFVHEGANTRPPHPTIKWLIKQLEKRNVGTGATRTSTISEVSTGKSALLNESKSKLTLTDVGKIAYHMLPKTHIGSLDMTESVHGWMKEIAEGKRDIDETLSIVEKWVSEDSETMAANALVMAKELGITAPEYVDLTWEGEPKRFKRTWAGHRFTDDEVSKLIAGEEIEIEAKAKSGKTFTAKGKLGAGEYNGKPTFGFQMSEIVGGKEKATGVHKPTGETVSFNKEWAGHTFTDEEIERLLDGEEISFTAKAKSGKNFEARGRLEKQKYEGREFWGFKLDTVPTSWAGHTFSESERATLRRGGEVHRNDFTAKSGKTFSATLNIVKGKLTPAFSKK